MATDPAILTVLSQLENKTQIDVIVTSRNSDVETLGVSVIVNGT